MLEETTASRSLNFTVGGFCNLANCSRRVNSFMLSGNGWVPVPRCVPSVRLNRSVFVDKPICSFMVSPALGTYSRASFSDGSMVMWNSPLMVGSTNSMMMLVPMPSRYRYRHCWNG